MKKKLILSLSVVLLLSVSSMDVSAAGRCGNHRKACGRTDTGCVTCYADADGDGICDYCGSGYTDADENGICDYCYEHNCADGQGAWKRNCYIDNNNDGVCDNYSDRKPACGRSNRGCGRKCR